MPPIEQENYNLSQLELIQSGSSQYTFPTNTGDYINFSIYEGKESINFRGTLDSQIYNSGGDNISGSFEYVIDATDTVRIKPNDVLDRLAYPTGNYIADFNFLRDIWFVIEE